MLAGGVLTETVSWNWIFFINVPIGLAAIVLAGRLFEADRGIGFGQGADILGAALVTGGLMVGVYAIVEEPLLGFVSVALLVAFVIRQAKASAPLLPLRISATVRSPGRTPSRS